MMASDLPPDTTAGRVVRVKRGEQPTHSPLSPFEQWAWKTFRERVTSQPPDPLLDEQLLKAHMRIRGDEYLAKVYATTVIAGAALLVVGILLAVLLLGTLGLFAIGFAVLLPVGGGAGAFFALKGAPGGKARSRGKAIDRKISSAMSFVSAMASADVNIDSIFKELARQTIYGEVAEEAAWITRDTELLGLDILTAIRNGAARTPSKRFQDFLQGVVTTATSGGQLKPYFLVKAEQYERENALELLRRVETMGLLAETFVTVVVAFPLFLVIIIAIFAIIGGGGAFMITVLYGIILGMIPLSQIGFIVFMHSLAQET
jgi:archaeal flagellar protein FlaJ